MKRGSRLSWLLSVLILGAVIGWFLINRRQPPIRIGVLHSLTGTLSLSERPLVDAVRLAVKEVNQAGGVLGRQIEPMIVDGRSEPDTFAAAAERLISEDEVAVVFGCWTSECRRTLRPVFEQHDHLLFYPVQYEGLESSANIVYTGAAPNQQIIPGVKWTLGNLGHRVFLVGSDYVFPRAANKIIHHYVEHWRGQVVGEEYLLLGSTDVGAIVDEIRRTAPDVILNTINGDSNAAFFTALREAGIGSDSIPTVSFSIAEEELAGLGGLATGDYAVWTYFQSINTAANRSWVGRFRANFGRDRVTDDPIEAAYTGVHMWAEAARRAGTTDVGAVLEALRGMSYLAPGGMVRLDADNQHLWKVPKVGRVREDGQFDILWTPQAPIRPEPYPDFETVEEWDRFLAEMKAAWGGRWANSGGSR